jgi:hypothetical protein
MRLAPSKIGDWRCGEWDAFEHCQVAVNDTLDQTPIDTNERAARLICTRRKQTYQTVHVPS